MATGQVKTTIRDVDKEITIHNMISMEELVDRSIGARGLLKLLAIGSLGFTLLATALAASGVYGVVAHSAAKRRTEIGIRKALGGTSALILLAFFAREMRPVLMGTALGLTGAWAFSRLLSPFMFRISTSDFPTFMTAAGFLVLTASVSCIFPLWREAGTQPVDVLRYSE